MSPEEGEPGDFTLPSQLYLPPISWFHNNTSTYLVDLALRMACAESRRVMERIFSTSEGLSDGAGYEALMEFPSPSASLAHTLLIMLLRGFALDSFLLQH